MPFTAVPATAPASTLLTAAADPAAAGSSIGTPTLWAVTIGAVAGAVRRSTSSSPARPHEVSMREAVGWSAFYIALPVGLRRLDLAAATAARPGVEYYTGYLVEKSLSVDNLFVFMLLLAAFAVPRELQQRVLLIGVVGALVLRGVFIALGAQLLAPLRLGVPALRRSSCSSPASRCCATPCQGHDHEIDIGSMRSVRLLRRLMPVTDDVRRHPDDGRATAAAGPSPRWRWSPSRSSATDIVFADRLGAGRLRHHRRPLPRLRHQRLRPARPARALLRARGRPGPSCVHLGYGLAAILGFIGVKLVLHWAHGVWPAVPEVPTLASLGVIVGILAVVTATSLRAGKRAGLAGAADVDDPEPEPAPTQR